MDDLISRDSDTLPAPGAGQTGFRQAYFDGLFEGNDDPWDFRQRWYERRKRALTLAALPAERYASGFEPGCANGELSAALATRCDTLLASDGSARAVDVARERLRGLPGVRVEQRILPAQWPESVRFDLIVISELAYYFDAPSMDQVCEHIEASLLPGGVLLACHWRYPIDGFESNGDRVHAVLQSRTGFHHLSHYQDADFLLDVWSNDAQSVAKREGL